MQKVKVLLKGKELCHAILCNNALKRLAGLMFRKEQSALIVLPATTKHLAAVHTMFMRFPIDIFWLNEECVIVDIAKDAKPFCINIAPKTKAKYILEMPSGTASIKQGDKLSFRKV